MIDLLIWIVVIVIISITAGIAFYLYYKKPKEIIIYQPLGPTELEQIMGRFNSLCGLREYRKVVMESFIQFALKVKQVYGINFNENWTSRDYLLELKKVGINGDAEKLANLYNEARYSNHKLGFEHAGESMRLFSNLYINFSQKDEEKKKPKIVSAEVVE